MTALEVELDACGGAAAPPSAAARLREVLAEALRNGRAELAKPRGKAGAYAIQSRIAAWISHIDGSHSSIMGLPLHETTVLLSRARVRIEV